MHMPTQTQMRWQYVYAYTTVYLRGYADGAFWALYHQRRVKMTENRVSGLGPLAIRIESPKPRQALIVAFLGGYGGIETHFARGFSTACLGDDNCNPAYHRTRKIWKGYAPVQMFERRTSLWHQAALEISEGVEHLLRGRQLRGEVWIFSRQGNKKNGAVTGVYSQRFADSEIPAPFDLLGVLRRFYHTNLLELDSENMLPPRTYQTPAPGPIPQCVERAGRVDQQQEESMEERRKAAQFLRDELAKNGFHSGGK